MNTLDELTNAVAGEPFNSILAAMLRDALMSERDMTQREAERHVERVQSAARPAEVVSTAPARAPKARRRK